MKPVISIIMGSKSDWATMQKAAEVLDNFGVAYEKKVVSAHRTPDLMFKHAEEARSRGIKVLQQKLRQRIRKSAETIAVLTSRSATRNREETRFTKKTAQQH